MAESADPTRRFSNRAQDYARYRPRYPDALVDVLARHAGLRPGWTIADIGCGTGLSALPFLHNGNAVIGVEPNDGMRAVADQVLAGFAKFRSVAGTAESTMLPEGCADLISIAHAFHWFDATRAFAEFRRIVKPGGPIVVLWHTRLTTGSPTNVACEALIERFGTDYATVRHDRYDAAVMDTYFGGPCTHHSIEHAEDLDAGTLRGRLFSFSYLPGPGDSARPALSAALSRMFDEYARDGRFRLDYRTEIHIGR